MSGESVDLYGMKVERIKISTDIIFMGIDFAYIYTLVNFSCFPSFFWKKKFKIKN